MSRKWITAGELAEWLSTFDAERPVIGYAYSNIDRYFNLEPDTENVDDSNVALVLIVRDDFDTRQW